MKDDANFTGYKAISVPGMLSGATSALQRFGSEPLKDVMAPAIASAMLFSDRRGRERSLDADFPSKIQVFSIASLGCVL